MRKNEFKKFLRECISETLMENMNSENSRIKENTKKKLASKISVRKSWGDINPVSRIHGQGKQGVKPKYDRKRDDWKKDVNESGWEVKPDKSTENIGKKDLENAKNIAYRIWSNVYLTRFHSTSKNGNDVFYVIKLDSNQGDTHWLVKNKDGNWKVSIGKGVESKWEPVEKHLAENKLSEMTGTSAAQGFMGKNWGDPDPARKRIKSIASRSVGGNVT